jgi:preprotein translocase subunit SecE
MNNMQQNIKKSSVKAKDTYLWIGMLIFLAVAIAADYYFSNINLALRLAGWLAAAVVLALVIMRTNKGKRLWIFIKDARSELRKVAWPTRQEAIRTTAIVALLVIIAVLVMWGTDSILLFLISWFIK